MGQEPGLGLQLGIRKFGASFYSLLGIGQTRGTAFKFVFLDNSVFLPPPSEWKFTLQNRALCGKKLLRAHPEDSRGKFLAASEALRLGGAHLTGY